MPQLTFIVSTQGHQVDRIQEMAERVRAHLPDVQVIVVEGETAKALLKQHKLNFGPAILVDGRLEYVGIPRWRFLQERLRQIGQGIPNPRTAAPATPAPKPGTPAQALGRPTTSPQTPATAKREPPPDANGAEGAS